MKHAETENSIYTLSLLSSRKYKHYFRKYFEYISEIITSEYSFIGIS